MASNSDSAGQIQPRSSTRLSVDLFLVSVLILFLEMILIRWVGTEIRIFAYLQNTILVIIFLGLGVGCFSSRENVELTRGIVALFVLVLLLTVPITREGFGKISILLSSLSDFVIWYEMLITKPGYVMLAVTAGILLSLPIILLLYDVFIPLGRLLGGLMDEHPQPIIAYSINIIGSLFGTWLLVVFSAFQLAPIFWFCGAIALIFSFVPRYARFKKASYGLLAAIALLSWFAGSDEKNIELVWSPYQKLSVQRDENSLGYQVLVNNVGYQWILDLSSQAKSKAPYTDPGQREMVGYSQYDIPFLLHRKPNKSLIVGAGAGNDVAGALRNNSQDITAVEIDPAIVYFGRKYHPEEPYSSNKVRVIIDDARSFFARTNERYDLISFGLLDSHTTTALTNARLDHYVYTIESLQRAKSLLREGGVMSLAFEARRPFIADRIARMLKEVFGEDPIAFRIPSTASGGGGLLFLCGDLMTVRERIANNPQLAELIKKWQEDSPQDFSYGTPIITDDWPYVYLSHHFIPVLFYLFGAIICCLPLYRRRETKIASVVRSWDRSSSHFFCLGAGFMLLEVQSISKAAVVLGNTWWVNAVIISGILIMILLANYCAARLPKLSLALVYFLLCLTCITLYFVDIAVFAFLPYLLKAVLVGGVTTLPVFFSGIVFIRSFAVTEGKNVALGANLIGALCGGLLQSISFLTGIKALLLLVTGFYIAAMVTGSNFRTRKARETS